MNPLAALLAAMDALRRQSGAMADFAGLGPVETPWQEVARWPGACLRVYDGQGGPPLLIVPAPFKRPYIWDLMPEVSVVRAALGAGFAVYLLEWLRPADGDFGLADYALRLPEAAVGEIGKASGPRRAALVGHSIGGTFAAIFAALRPDRVGRLGLVDAPLAFGRDGGPLAEAVRRAPDARAVATAVGGPVPGSAINLFSAAAAPDAFIAQRLADAAATLASPEARAIQQRVMRWSLDEFPLPARLFQELAEGLYRDDRFRQGSLEVAGEVARLTAVAAPIVAVVNPAGQVVPPRSVLAGLRSARPAELLVLRYRAEPGPALQHLGPLVAPGAHARLWPRILGWLGRD